jgi:hypothetical protein
MAAFVLKSTPNHQDRFFTTIPNIHEKVNRRLYMNRNGALSPSSLVCLLLPLITSTSYQQPS